MTHLSKEDFLKPRDRQYETVYVEELGGSVTIRALKTSERSKFESSLLNKKGERDPDKTAQVRERLIVATVVEPETKELMFGKRDIEAIGGLPARAIEVIFDKARELAGMTESDVEELEGNSETDQAD